MNYETFDSIVADPGRFFKGKNRVICIPAQNDTTTQVNQSPSIVFGGKAAATKIKLGLREAFKKNPKFISGFCILVPEVKAKFQILTGADIDLFEPLPLSAFPSTHPFHSNGALELLTEYQQAKNVPIRIKQTKGVFDVNCNLSNVVYVCLLGSLEAKNQLDNDCLHIGQTTRPDIPSLFIDVKESLFMVYDQHNNVWVSSDTLRSLLIGVV